MSKLPWADKSLGQHFLVNQNVIEKITSDFHQEAEWIIEVGPGPGILSEKLSHHQLPFHAIDKDSRFRQILEKFMDPLNIHIEDALESDLSSYISQWFDNNPNGWLVSNLPYNVSTPLLIKFIEERPIRYMTLMFQKEVAEKVFLNQPTNKSMGSLMALTQTYFDVSLLSKVSPGSFSPPPKVQSSVLSFKRKEHPVVDLSEFKKFELFLRKLFSQKRKQASSVLKGYRTPDELLSAFTKANCNLTDRAETFNLGQIHILYKELKK